jgi:hypothetical protein
VGGLTALAWGVVAVSFGSLATYAETHWGVFLWRSEEWLELYSPSRYVDRGRGRIMVIGPSEAREALVAEPFEAALPGFEFYNDAMSFSTLEDGITQLEYIERVYGQGAFPEVLILTVTQRYVLDFAPGERPLVIAMNKYSPAFWIDESVEPQQLRSKHLGASLISRVRLVGHEGSRYRRAIQSLAARLRLSEPADWPRQVRRLLLVSHRYHHKPHIASPELYWEHVEDETGLYHELRDMPAEPHRDSVAGHFQRLREMAARNDSQIFVVNMPEASWRRAFYAQGIYEDYRSLLMRAAGSLPVFDLRESVPDELYFDTLHVDRDGAYDFSQQVAERLAAALAGELAWKSQ